MGRKNAVQFKKSRYWFTLGIVWLVMGIALGVFLFSDYQTAPLNAVARRTQSQFYQSTAPLTMLLGALFLLVVLYFLGMGFYWRRKERLALEEERKVSERLRGLAGGGATADEFLATRDALRQSDFTGVYVLHNKSKDMYYVGQSVKVIDRVGQHLTGHGNGDVYADFKYGDEFEVSTVSLVDSGYGSLNDLERDTIAAYDAYNNGYNRTAGNSR